MIRHSLLLAVAVCLAGCTGTVGQTGLNVLSADDLIKLMQAPNASGCLRLEGVYPPFIVGEGVIVWGNEPPLSCEH